METTSALPFHELKREALTGRVNKLIEWLHRPDYAVYINHGSTLHLIKMINLTVWALERSIRPDEWDPFRQEFLGARYLALDEFGGNDEWERSTYYTVLGEVEASLQSYLEYIKGCELVRVF